jgi:hypothetical protein
MTTKLTATLAVLLAIATRLSAQGGGAEEPKTSEHEHLALFAGEWDIQLTMHMGPEPVKTTAVASEKLVMDGLYLLMLVSGEMGGKAFEGRALTGYDRHAKEFVSVWVDTDSTKASFSRGTFDPKTKSMTMTGEMASPSGMMKTRSVANVKEDGGRTETVWAKGEDGSEKVLMEFVFTRRKDPASLKAAPVDPKKAPEELGKLAGKWTAVMKMSQKGADGDVPVGTSKATETSSLICGGKWLWTELESDFGGEKHVGYAIQGHDPESKKYTSVWCDSHGGTFDVAVGTSDGKTRAMEGTTYDPAGTKIKWWETSSWTDADHRSLIWKIAGSGSQPMMQIQADYARVK